MPTKSIKAQAAQRPLSAKRVVASYRGLSLADKERLMQAVGIKKVKAKATRTARSNAR
jgi:hypothetical protein